MPIINENHLVNENNDSSNDNKKRSKYQENNYGVIIDLEELNLISWEIEK